MFLPKSSEAAFFLAMLPSTSSIEQDKNRLCWATDRVQNESVLVYQMGSQHANGVKCAHPPPTPAVKPLQMPLFQGGAVPSAECVGCGQPGGAAEHLHSTC